MQGSVRRIEKGTCRAQSVVGNVETGLPDRKCIRNAQKIMAGQLLAGDKNRYKWLSVGF